MKISLKEQSAHAISLKTEEKTYTFYRKEVSISSVFLLSWLSCESQYPKMYFETKEGDQTIATVGKIFSFKQAPIIFAQIPVYLMASLSFDSSSKGFFVPQIEIVRKENSFTLSYNSLDLFPDEIELHQRILPKASFTCSDYKDLPEFDVWKKNIQTALHTTLLEKIVLARKSTFSINSPPDPFSLLSELKEKTSQCFFFAVQWNEDLSFVGVSPERLFQRKKDLIITDVIAGTRKRGKNSEEDQKKADELWNSIKDRLEFTVVKEAILKCLAPYCTQVEISPLSLFKTPQIFHLHHQISGRLERPNDQSLIDSLHPTPAVGGWPKDQAIHFLKEYEPFNRGFYAAPIGFLSPNHTDLAVGIRSCLLEKNQVHLFAGTGIVDGSTPEREWEELEQKLHLFKNEIFHVRQ